MRTTVKNKINFYNKATLRLEVYVTLDLAQKFREFVDLHGTEKANELLVIAIEDILEHKLNHA